MALHPTKIDRECVQRAAGSSATLEHMHFERLLELARSYSLWFLFGPGASWSAKFAWQNAINKYCDEPVPTDLSGFRPSEEELREMGFKVTP